MQFCKFKTFFSFNSFFCGWWKMIIEEEWEKRYLEVKKKVKKNNVKNILLVMKMKNFCQWCSKIRKEISVFGEFFCFLFFGSFLRWKKWGLISLFFFLFVKVSYCNIQKHVRKWMKKSLIKNEIKLIFRLMSHFSYIFFFKITTLLKKSLIIVKKYYFWELKTLNNTLGKQLSLRRKKFQSLNFIWVKKKREKLFSLLSWLIFQNKIYIKWGGMSNKKNKVQLKFKAGCTWLIVVFIRLSRFLLRTNKITLLPLLHYC